MSRRGQCWDNAPAESFFGRSKEELFPANRWTTKATALAEINNYIGEYYSLKGIKLRLGCFSPVEYELGNMLVAQAV